MKTNLIYKLLSLFVLMLFLLACNAPLVASTATAVIPTSLPPTSIALPINQLPVSVTSQPFEETGGTPKFILKAQIPQLTGSNDPRVLAFNQRLAQLVNTEIDMWRKSFQENTAPQVNDMGSSLDVTYTQMLQSADIWSFKFDFHFYSDGAAHPGSYSMTVNHDLEHGRELALSDLFLPGSDYLGLISTYCIAELGRQPFFEGPFTDGAQPKPENYSRWNITPEGLLITFDDYQVAPHAAGPQNVLVPYSELRSLIDPNGALAQFIQ